MRLNQIIGSVVQYELDGVVVFWGVAEYIRAGWIGIRQVGGRLDEAPADRVRIDPT